MNLLSKTNKKKKKPIRLTRECNLEVLDYGLLIRAPIVGIDSPSRLLAITS